MKNDAKIKTENSSLEQRCIPQGIAGKQGNSTLFDVNSSIICLKVSIFLTEMVSISFLWKIYGHLIHLPLDFGYTSHAMLCCWDCVRG